MLEADQDLSPQEANGRLATVEAEMSPEDGVQRARLLLWQANPRVPIGNEYQGLYGDESLTTVLDFFDRSRIQHAILDFDMTTKQFDPNSLSQVTKFTTK